MRERSDGGGFTVLDGVALVMGAAVASIHLRELVSQRRDLTALGWGLVWLTFTGVALSATGPFLFLERRYGRRPAGYPRRGDWLWAVLGLPWSVTAALRPAPGPPGRASEATLYALLLGLLLGAASLIALGVVWNTWVIRPPVASQGSPPAPWTDRVGLALAVAWPLQCGFGLVVLG